MVIIDGMPASKPQIATYPRKGTGTKHLCNKRQGIALQFIPARGRKQLFDEPLVFAVHCNLSPQGDGNDGLNVGIVKNMFIAIYPRKGTKKHLCHWRLPAAEVLCFFLIFYFTGWKLCQPESSL